MRGSSARPLELLPETAANKKWGGGKSARIMVHIRYSLVHIRCFDLRVEPPTIHSYIQPKKILPWCFRCLGTMTRGFSPERSSIRIFQLEASFRTIVEEFVGIKKGRKIPILSLFILLQYLKVQRKASIFCRKINIDG